MRPKILFIIAAIIVLYALCYANSPFFWQDDGVPIRKGCYVEWTGQMMTVGDDKAVVVWSDARNGKRELWTQAVDSNGIVWNDGESILIASSETANESPVLTATSDGNVIVAWVDYDYQTETGSIYAQKISAAGELMWENQVLISRDNVRGSSKERNSDEQHRCPYYPYIMDSLEMVPNNEGGAYIFWFDERNGETYEIYGMHLNGEGQPYSEEWTEGGILFTSGEGDKISPNLCQDGANGVILAYVVYNSIYGSNGVVKRITADGNIEWENDSPTGDESDYVYEISVSPFGEDAFGLAVGYSKDIYRRVAANAVNIEGEYLWDEVLPVDIEAPGSNFNQSLSRSVNTVDNDFAIVWKDDRERGKNLYAQKFNIEGDRLWGDRGERLAELNQNYICYYDLEPDNAGGIIVAWEGYYSAHRKRDIYAQHITTAGELKWDNGKPFAKSDNQNFKPALRFRGDNLFFASGDASDNTAGIHVQVYDTDYEPIFADSGEIIHTGLDGIAGSQKALKSGEYIYVVWLEGYYDPHIRVQKIDREGNPQFAENGIMITEVSSIYSWNMVSAVPHHSGGIVVAWTQRVDGHDKVFVQAINPDGERLWTDDRQYSGIRMTVTDNDYYQDRPMIYRDGESYIIVWDQTDPGEDWTYHRTIAAQKITTGSRVWGEDGVDITMPRQDEDSNQHFIQSVINGGYIIWTQDGPHKCIYVTRIDENGQTAEGWNDRGIRVTEPDPETEIRQYYPTVLIADKELLILWSEREAANIGSYSDIYGQLISEDGERLWGEHGKEIAAYNNNQRRVSAQYDEGYVYLAFIDERSESFRSNIAYQKIDLEGNLIWGEYAPFVSEKIINKRLPQLVKSGNSLLIIWLDMNMDFYRTNNLRMQLVSASTGQRFWGDEGLMVSDYYQRPGEYRLCLIDDRYAFIVWSDLRSFRSNYDGADLYAQKIDLTYNLNVDEDTLMPVEKMTLNANYPNPFNPDTNISFALARDENVNLRIYNIRGQLVKNLIDREYREQGYHSVVWNGTDNSGNTVSSGVYLYKLDSEQESRTRKMILMK